MKNRYHPFGYAIQNGVLGIVPDEAAAVKRIFRAYGNGSSYQSIADKLSNGPVSYIAGTPVWNKHMVKRILENEKYLGMAPYEPIIARELFDQAASIRQSKGWQYSLPPEHIKALRARAHCAQCGSALVRMQKGQPAQWVCTGDGCGIKPSDDDRLIEGVMGLLNMLVANPNTIEIPPADTTIQSTRLIRLNNELTRQLDSLQCSEEESITLILAAAAEKYAVCDDGSKALAGRRLKQVFSGMEPLAGFDVALFIRAVQAVLVDVGGQIQLILTNGQRFPAYGETVTEQHEII